MAQSNTLSSWIIIIFIIVIIIVYFMARTAIYSVSTARFYLCDRWCDRQLPNLSLDVFWCRPVCVISIFVWFTDKFTILFWRLLVHLLSSEWSVFFFRGGGRVEEKNERITVYLCFSNYSAVLNILYLVTRDAEMSPGIWRKVKLARSYSLKHELM